MAGYISALIGLLLMSGVFWAVANSAKKGNLPRNSAVGIRTKATQASDKAWNMAHQVAAPYLMVAAMVGLVGTVVSVGFLPFFLESGQLTNDAVVLVPIIALVIQILLLLQGSMKANSAAKKV